MDWAWLRFAPLTVSSLVAVGAVAGTFSQFIGDLGVDPTDVTKIGGVGHELSTAPLWLGISLFALVVLVIAVLGSVLIFVEAWWGFRLLREPGGTLRIQHGLLTTRSVSLEERRLRGVVVDQPLLLRIGKGARATAVATGLGGARQSRGTLLPPAPLEEAHQVAGLVLEEHPSPTMTQLRAHPRTALRRRLVRAVVPVLLVAAVLWLAPVPSWLVWIVLATLPLTLPLAFDAYRNLGHNLTDRYLLTRHGVGVRRTIALQRAGVIGWTVSQTFFQRRAGLVTLAATTAAGTGAYQVIDVETAEGLAVAEEAVPGLLTPFLERDDRPSRTSTGSGASAGSGTSQSAAD
jgi:putative membrane protein